MDKCFNRLVFAGLAVLIAGCAQDKTNESAPAAPDAVIDTAPSAEAEEVAPLNENTGPAYVGLWAGEGANCALTPGAGVTAPIALTQGEFIADGNNCIIAVAEEGTDAGWALELVCVDPDGVEVLNRVEVQVADDVLTMRRDDGGEAAYARCP